MRVLDTDIYIAQLMGISFLSSLLREGDTFGGMVVRVRTGVFVRIRHTTTPLGGGRASYPHPVD